MKGFTVWFTGLSGSGKTTLARALEEELKHRGFHVEVLDGDEVFRMADEAGISIVAE